MANETAATENRKKLKDGVSLVLVDTGETFSGWENLSISKNLDSIASTFSFSYDNKFDTQNKIWPIRPGDKIRVLIGSEVIVTGRVETMTIGFSADTRVITVTGRSLVGDVIDSMVPADVIQYTGPLKAFAEELVRPFGLSVFLSVVPTNLDKFSTKPGETVFTALDRMARLQGFFWISTRSGNIRLTEAGVANAETSIEQDINILGASVEFNESKRFQTYTVLAQRSSVPGFEKLNVSGPIGFARDNGINRYRPFVQIADGSLDSAGCAKSAGWEASFRAAKAMVIKVELQGWRQSTGTIWGLNQLIRFKSSWLGLNDTFLSKNVNHIKSNSQGTITRITLVRKDSFKSKPEISEDTDPLKKLGLK